MILPGYEPIYVFLCPLRKEESPSPPIPILINYLLRALAMEEARLVFPVPGGPIRQIIFPSNFPLSFPTAMN